MDPADINIPVLAAALNQMTHFHIENNIMSDFTLMVASIRDYRTRILPVLLQQYKKAK